jgi:hypothetical protein
MNSQNKKIETKLLAPPKPDYYTTEGRKVGDFVLGFFSSELFWPIFFFIMWLLRSILLGFIVTMLLMGLSIFLSFKKGRRFIAVGMIATALIFALIQGSCLAALSHPHITPG